MNDETCSFPLTRRGFNAGALASLTTLAASAQSINSGDEIPWYRRTFRWGQTNLNEKDPVRYDVGWWRRHWRRTHVQGLVINAGGIVSFYPSKFPLHYRAKFLADRDFYGEITRAAHDDGIAVLARMDSNRTTEDFYKQHPDWFAVDVDGNPYRAAERYITCVDSPYYEQYLQDVYREIIAWEKPEGFTDNSWSGLDRNSICYCKYSRESFRNATGKDLPRRKDWNDQTYREWIEWGYARRVEIWDLNNRTTKDAGGPDCLWLGMIGGDFVSQGRRLRDLKTLLERTEVVMLDDQSRSVSLGFQENAEMGKRLHGLLGWEKIIPESMATYQRSPVFRKAAASPEESRQWMYSGFAGGIQPWWHHVGAYQWDRRQFEIPISVYDWYAKNERYLVNRTPVAAVGVVYSQRNADFYGRDEAEERVAQPYYGVIQALIKARIPYLPVHADQVDENAKALSTLVLPNLATMTDEQIASVRRYAENGGNLVASGEIALYDKWGERRENSPLADLFGIRFQGQQYGSLGEAESWTGGDHSYLRLHPDVGQDVYGPLSGAEPAVSGDRHPILSGLEKTDIVAFGGLLQEVEPTEGSEVLLTLIPDFPAYPPETSWMRTERTQIPGLVLRDDGGSRRAYFAADLDRRFARDYLPDHGRLIANTIRWTAHNDVLLKVRGPGLIDCHLYRQQDRMILHLVNLSGAGAWRSPLQETIPVGPVQVSIQLPAGGSARAVELLVADQVQSVALNGRWASFELESIGSHEVAVLA